MRRVIRSEERGHANHGWLDSFHTFSFADYYNPKMMGYRSLRVINEDKVDGAAGFPLHPHRDMEILTYMISGALEHRDTLGSHRVVRRGEIQRMSAGSGVRHSEMNPEANVAAHLLQIWIQPDKMGIFPEYEQADFSKVFDEKSQVLVASGDGRDGSMRIHQDVDLWVCRMRSDERIQFNLRQGRGLWVQLVAGCVNLESESLNAGDALVVEGEEVISLFGESGAEFLVFDLK